MINGSTNNWLLGHWNNSVANYFAEGWVSAVGAGGTDTNWRVYVGNGNVSGDSYSFYVNDILSAGPNSAGAQGPNGISIGRYGGGSSEHSIGEFAFVLVYNRVLTLQEMTQNFNAKKSRFGI